MKAFKTLFLTKSIAAALVAGSGIAAPAISHASPDDGMVCRVGYNGQFAGGDLKCTKTKPPANAALSCLDTRFPNKLIRVIALPSSDGKDICLALGRNATSNGPLTGLTLNQDYAFATLNPAKPVAIRIVAERTEEQSLGLADADVDARAAVAPVIVDGGFGGEDAAPVTVTLFTFAIPAPTFSLQPLDPLLPRL